MRKGNKTLRQKKWKEVNKNDFFDKKAIKENEPKINVLTHELLASTLSYLILVLWRYFNPSNISSHTPPILSLVFLYLPSHYRFILLPYYGSVLPRASVGYVQTTSNDVTQASPRLVPPLISDVCYRSGHDLFLCCHKSIVTYAS
jgi:hypothetical protein